MPIRCKNKKGQFAKCSTKTKRVRVASAKKTARKAGRAFGYAAGKRSSKSAATRVLPGVYGSKEEMLLAMAGHPMAKPLKNPPHREIRLWRFSDLPIGARFIGGYKGKPTITGFETVYEKVDRNKYRDVRKGRAGVVTTWQDDQLGVVYPVPDEVRRHSGLARGRVSKRGHAGGRHSVLGSPLKRIPAAYAWLVVDPYGNVWAGNEFQNDAKDALKEMQSLLPAGSKVVARRTYERMAKSGHAGGRSKLEKALGLQEGELYGADEQHSTHVAKRMIFGKKVEFDQNEDTGYISAWSKGIGNLSGGYSLPEAMNAAKASLIKKGYGAGK